MTETSSGPSPTPAELSDQLLDAFLDAEPVVSSLLGLPGRDDRLADVTRAGEETMAARLDAVAERAARVDADGLSEVDRQTLDVVLHAARSSAASTRIGGIEFTVTDLFNGPAASVVGELSQLGLTTTDRAEGYLVRLGAVGEFLDTALDRHREGVARGRAPVARLVRNAVAHARRLAGDQDAAGLRLDATAGAIDPTHFAEQRDTLIAGAVLPALARYADGLETDVLGAARDDDHPGVGWLPGGDEVYGTLARYFTSTDRSPDELHATGLQIVADLAAEYREVGGRAFGSAAADEVFQRLRTDTSLRYADADNALEMARAAVARAEAAAPQWFGRVPATSCRVEPIPENDAPGSAPAYYLPPAMDGSRMGTYFLNTYRATERTTYDAEATAFHEAVPGHHFQLSLSQELTGLPLFRRLVPSSAFSEGWGLYSERLADEMGLYSSDVTRLGMLSADSWRASRLVVDTGLHAMGWSRAKAVTFMAENTPLPQVTIEAEVDRYIAMPGQALSYMVGRLEIQRLRRSALDALGDSFDLKAFHDLLMSVGSPPLQVLAGVVDRWVAAA